MFLIYQLFHAFTFHLCNLKKENLYYITESLFALREVRYEDFERLTPEILTKVKEEQRIQINWMNGFLMLAAEISTDAFN